MKLLLSLCFLCLPLAFLALDNDNCASAELLPVNTTCSPQTFSTDTATDSGDATPSCGFYQGADAWFTFTAPADGQFRVEFTGITGNPRMSMYVGSCGSLTALNCGNINRNFNDPALGGVQIYLQLFAYNSTAPATFELCVIETDPVVNDDCEDATVLVAGTECTFQAFSNQYATDQPGIAPGPGCGFYQGGDVWFRVNVPASGNLRVEMTDIGDGSPHFALYSGSCGAMSLIDCMWSGDIYNIKDPALASQDIYIRVFRYNSGERCDFELCVFEPIYVANDDCANAFDLPVGSGCVPTSYTTEYATAEAGIAPSPGCGFYLGGDVWFTVEVPLSGKLVVEIEDGAVGNAHLSVYEGSCGAMSVLDCQENDGTVNINDPSLAGETLYVRIFRYNSYQPCTFDLCAWEPPTPDNDHCDGAFALSVGTEPCVANVYNTIGATSEDGIAPSPNCGFYSGRDVWFTFTMPASGHLRADINEIDGNSTMALYQGTCGSMTLVECTTIDLMNIHDESLAGQQMYMRVYRYASTLPVTFGLCVWEPAIPDYDFCELAQPIDLADGCQTYDNSYTTTTDGYPAPGCGFYNGNDVWFTVEVPASGLLNIEVERIVFPGKVLSVYTGDCNGLTLYECASNGSDTNDGALIIDDPALIGQTIYLRIFSYAQILGSEFILCVYDPSDCQIYQINDVSQGECNPETGWYDQTIEVEFINAPATGSLNVNGIDYTYTTSPATIVITDQFANNQIIGVTAYFTDEATCTYFDPVGYIEPGSCYCPADLNDDGAVTTSDLLSFLSVYGCASGCPVDFNGDDSTDTADLLILLGQIGSVCP